MFTVQIPSAAVVLLSAPAPCLALPGRRDPGGRRASRGLPVPGDSPAPPGPKGLQDHRGRRVRPGRKGLRDPQDHRDLPEPPLR